ncbi:hypothetical protein EVAR_88685_1 [Eumeta japonica]|uniref:Uncharacterized protein n=1 Tax=Eumeta variegata TaxID=151549 RepID=A0A4C1Y4Y4_EUMVA|nr:hypothetical protein EVAR_88685_1 [Eumeta japonica]
MGSRGGPGALRLRVSDGAAGGAAPEVAQLHYRLPARDCRRPADHRRPAARRAAHPSTQRRLLTAPARRTSHAARRMPHAARGAASIHSLCTQLFIGAGKSASGERARRHVMGAHARPRRCRHGRPPSTPTCS